MVALAAVVFVLALAAGSAQASVANTNFVNQVYLDLLGRPADAAALAAYVPALDNLTLSRATFAGAITSSQEYRTDQIGAYWQSYLGSAAAPATLAPLVGLMNSGVTFEGVQSMILGSPAFMTEQGGTNSGFISALYLDVLNSAVDPTVESHYLALMGGGETAEQVAANVLAGSQYQTDLVINWYAEFLRRSPNPSELVGFTIELAGGLHDETAIDSLVSSDEYYAFASTPEPATLVLVGLGLAALAARRRRK